MSSTWTPEQVSSLAPDTNSLKIAGALATARKWVLLGQGEEMIWGLCQGSGSKPYQTAVSLPEPAFRCSCPSRKFPCKHALALFLLFARQPDLLTTTKLPDWVISWRENRVAQAAKQESKSDSRPAADPAAQALRVEKREQKVEEGLAALELWLQDLLRRGLAVAQKQPYHYWEGIAARMVDAQAPGLARQLRRLATIPNASTDWPEQLLHRLALLHLLIQGYRRLDTLPAARQADVRTAVGWPVKQEELLAQAGVRDLWLIMGQRTEEEDGLRTQYTWLWGRNSQQPALILDFAYRNQPLVTTLPPGRQLDAELVFYPGSVPWRALCKSQFGDLTSIDGLPGHDSLATAVTQFNDMVARNPWLELVALPLNQLMPSADSSGWRLHDSTQGWLPLLPTFTKGWELLALSGGRPLDLVVEWNGQFCRPIAVWADGRLVTLA